MKLGTRANGTPSIIPWQRPVSSSLSLVATQASWRDCPGRNSIEIDPLNGVTLMVAVTDEVGEVLAGDFALTLDAEGLVTAGVELLNRALQSDAEGIGRETEDFADGPGDAGAVDMGVVHLGQLGGDLGVQAVGEGLWDLVEDVIGRGEGCCWRR